MIRSIFNRVVVGLVLLTCETPWNAANAQTTGGDVSASVPEAGAQALAGALAAATVEPSSGILRSSLEIALPAARGMSQPGLGLTYSSAAGVREAGIGWGLSLPVIERSTKRGAPNLDDDWVKPNGPGNKPVQAHPDELLFNGQRLVPICEVGAAKNPCTLLGPEPFPAWALGAGTRYYRPEVDTHIRCFWSPGRSTWRVQMPGGETLELGVPEVSALVDAANPPDLNAGVDYDEITKLVAQPVSRKVVIYFGARYYQPHLGRWMSADPKNVHGVGSDLNPYAYAGGKVATQTDPDGLDTCVAIAQNASSCQGPDGPYTFLVVGMAFSRPPNSEMGPSASGVTSRAEVGAPEPIAKKPFDPGASMSSAQRYIWGGTGAFHDVVTSDTFWATQQYVYGGIALGAATIATGGVALEAVGVGTAEGFAATALVNAGRVAQAFTTMSLAEQDIVGVGAAGSAMAGAEAIEGAEAKAFVSEVGSLAGKRGRPEQLIRYGSEAEATATKAAGGLVPRPGHTGSKRVAEAGARIDPRRLGSEKSYSHKIRMEVQPGTTQWLRRWGIEGEPGRYAIPADMVARFNLLIRSLGIERVR